MSSGGDSLALMPAVSWWSRWASKTALRMIRTIPQIIYCVLILVMLQLIDFTELNIITSQPPAIHVKFETANQGSETDILIFKIAKSVEVTPIPDICNRNYLGNMLRSIHLAPCANEWCLNELRQTASRKPDKAITSKKDKSGVIRSPVSTSDINSIEIVRPVCWSMCCTMHTRSKKRIASSPTCFINAGTDKQNHCGHFILLHPTG